MSTAESIRELENMKRILENKIKSIDKAIEALRQMEEYLVPPEQEEVEERETFNPVIKNPPFEFKAPSGGGIRTDL